MQQNQEEIFLCYSIFPQCLICFIFFFPLYLIRHNLFAMYSSKKALSNVCDAGIYWQRCLVLPYVTVLILIIHSSFSLNCCIFCFQSSDWCVMWFLVSHQCVLIALDRKGILILSNNNGSLKFDSSVTFELSPQGEKKATTRFFLLCCSEKLREWGLLFNLLINPKWLKEFCSNFLKNHFGNKSENAF